MVIRPEASTSWNRIWKRVLGILQGSPLLKFLLVGGLSFALDLGLLVVLHEFLGVELVLSTTVAFLVSLVFNFVLQRTFTFQAANNKSVSAAKYIALVVVNVAVTDLIVKGFDSMDLWYGIGKVVATVLTTAWNFFLYRHWIFRNDKAADAKQQTP